MISAPPSTTHAPLLAVLAVFVTLSSPPASAAPDTEMPCTILVGARLIDGTGSPAMEDAVLVLKGDRIAAAGDHSSIIGIQDGARVLDVKGDTIMPGLISAHSHLGLVQGAFAASPEN